MTEFFLILNVNFLLVIFCWSCYKIHVSESWIKRVCYILIGLTTSIVIVAHVVPDYYTIYYQNYAWQRLLFNGAIAFRCVVECYCEYGSARWIEAFRNSKKRFLHLTKRI